MHIEPHTVPVNCNWNNPPSPNLGKAVAFKMISRIHAIIWFKAHPEGITVRARQYYIATDHEDFGPHARHVGSDIHDDLGYHLLQHGP